jgi:hypothetical protein
MSARDKKYPPLGAGSAHPKKQEIYSIILEKIFAKIRHNLF